MPKRRTIHHHSVKRTSRRRSSFNRTHLIISLVGGFGLLVFLAVRFGYFGGGNSTFAVPQSGTATVQASVDTFVLHDKPAQTQQGTWMYMNLDNTVGSEHYGLVRFTTTGIPVGSTTTAKLRMFVSNGTRKDTSLDSAGAVYTVSGAWSETTNWNTKPTMGNQIATFSPSTPVLGGWEEADVSSVVTGDGTYDFYLGSTSPTHDDIVYATREATPDTAGSTDFIPQLVVDWVGPDINPTATGSATATDTPVPPTATPTATGVASPTPTVAAATVTHGPAIGAMTDSTAKVFVRTSAPTSVRIAYSTSSVYDPASAALSSEAFTTSSTDNTAIIPIGPLQANLKYYYWVAINSLTPDTSNTYEFTTFPTTSDVKNFTFAIFSDLAAQDSSSYAVPGYARAAGFNPAFVGQIGDARHDDPAGANNILDCTNVNIQNWWTQAQKVYGTTPAGLDFGNNIAHKFPIFHIWDDHDFGSNNSDGRACWKDIATNSFRQYYPLYSTPVAGTLYHTFRYGKLATFIVMDLRSQRTKDLATDNSSKTMLGSAQKAQLKADLLAANDATNGTTWKFLISSSLWNNHSKTDDSWYLYQTERSELLNFLSANGIKNVIVIDGDLHSGGALDTQSGLVELNIPHTNIYPQNVCTGDTTQCNRAGSWNVKFNCAKDNCKASGTSNAGFGLINVTDASVNLKIIRSSDGLVNIDYTTNKQ